jgi:hypothetical protein
MINIKNPVVLGVVASLALGIFAAVPAHADPVTDSYAIVGSDTLQDSVNALVNGTAVTASPVRIKAAGQAIGNFDAFGSTNIQTKPSKGQIVRPTGSGAGVTALLASISGATGLVDIARSSAGPTAPLQNTGILTWVPYGRDGVSYAYLPDPAAPNDLANLTTAQLKSIYESSTASPVTIGTTVVKPLIPQDQSGTRKFFLSAIGATLGTGPTSTYNGVANTLPENNATVLTQVGQIVPFSAGNWIAQSNGAAPSTILAGTTVALGSPNGVAPYSGSGTALVPNATFYASSLGRETYLVVETARITSGNAKYDAVLAGLVNPSNTGSLTDFSSASFKTRAGAVKLKFGFTQPTGTVLYSDTK